MEDRLSLSFQATLDLQPRLSKIARFGDHRITEANGMQFPGRAGFRRRVGNERHSLRACRQLFQYLHNTHRVAGGSEGCVAMISELERTLCLGCLSQNRVKTRSSEK